MISEKDWDTLDLEATETFIEWEEDFVESFLGDRKDRYGYHNKEKRVKGNSPEGPDNSV
jgi:hypothetical protein